uniref:TED_complement domain-containing protein n=1 Tax=Mesocestoides corti TaxID=53468 RepID=A0A5K3G268_MESCO
LAIELPDNAIVEGSLRTYITISGNVIGKALSNLDQLVQVPTGCGEQNLVKVAPSVYVLHYLLKATNFSSTHEDKLAKLAAKYIVRGFDNQLKYQHPHDGSFSTFGPHYGANGSTWLTAYVFEVFSEAEKLPLRHLAGQSLDAHATLVRAFDFLTTRLRADDGCFDEAGDTFISWMRTGFEAERRLRLTSHVLAAITAASKPLIETKRTSYANTIDSAIRCITKTAQQLPMKQWSTSMLAKVAFALSRVPAHKQPPLHNAIVTELLSRSQTVSSISGSLRWWPASESSEPVTYHHSRASDLETTAYALLALSDNDLTKADQLATMR